MPHKYQTSFLQTTPPDGTALVTSLDLVKGAARVPLSFTGDDELFKSYIRSGESLLEAQAEIAIRPQKWTMQLAQWPDIDCSAKWWMRHRFLRVELETISAIDSVHYYDEDDADQVWTAGQYRLLPGHPPKVFVNGTTTVPNVSDRPDAWTIIFSAGSSTIRPEVHTFIQIYAAYIYRNPEDQGKMPSDTASRRLCDNLIDALRWRVYP